MRKSILGLLIASLVALSMGAQEYTFATYPFTDAAKIYSAFAPLTEYLSENSPYDFRLVVTRDYDELSQRIVDGTVDFAWIGSSNYVKTVGIAPQTKYLATYREWSSDGSRVQPFYQSFILTLEASEIYTLSDLRHLNFAFTSPGSTSGYAYPRLILAQNDIDPEQYFANTYFLGKHDNVIAALISGSIAAGAVSDGTYYNAIDDHGPQFRILAESQPIPLDAMVAVDHVPTEVWSDVQELLDQIGSDHPINDSIKMHLGWSAAGFEVRSDAFYDSVRAAARIVEGP